MKKASKRGRKRRAVLLIVAFLILTGSSIGLYFSIPSMRPWWKTLTRESRRIIGWDSGEIPPEEKRIREEVILKKMEESNLKQDWRSLAPEYPRPRKLESLEEKERRKVLRGTPEFKEMDKEVRGYLREKENLFHLEPPIPPLKDAMDFTHLKDKGVEKAMERLLGSKAKAPQEKPLEENLQLGIKGPLTFRKILERPQPPKIKLKVETEIELTLWVLPNGIVDRAVPSVKGDMELERIAIQYLKQWRFIPLPSDQPQVDQWGTIPIKFKLQ